MSGALTLISCSTVPPAASIGPGGGAARGVTATEIKIGFSYIDLQTLAQSGLIKIDHGPYQQIITALVNDVNAHGGIDGRKLKLYTAKYLPIGTTQALGACTQLTEDDGVFADLGGVLSETNLCFVQQHDTILIGGGSVDARTHAKARAPWITWDASPERSLRALVDLMQKSGQLRGASVGVYASNVADTPLVTTATSYLRQVGDPAAATAVLDVPATDLAGVASSDKVIVQRFRAKHVDTVLDVSPFVPAADFDANGYYPKLFTLSAGYLQAAAFTNPLGKFPLAEGITPTDKTDAAMTNPAFQHCMDVWQHATGRSILSPEVEDKQGHSSGFVAMLEACTSLQIFVTAAKAAGRDLNNVTFLRGVQSIGAISLPTDPLASFGPGKLDGQDDFALMRYNPAYRQGSGLLSLLPTGYSMVMR